MGSLMEFNDTLQITTEQGFPAELDYEKHKIKPFIAEDFDGKIFEFKDKSKTRIFHLPPVRNFLAHNINDKWLYWGQIHITELVYDTVKQTTSGKFKIIYLYTPEEMQHAHSMLDRRKETDFLNVV